MDMHWKSHMAQAIRVIDWRPEPPTPTRRPLPRGCVITRETRARCKQASAKKTRFIGLVDTALKSAHASSNLACVALSSVSSYSAWLGLGLG